MYGHLSVNLIIEDVKILYESLALNWINLLHTYSTSHQSRKHPFSSSTSSSTTTLAAIFHWLLSLSEHTETVDKDDETWKSVNRKAALYYSVGPSVRVACTPKPLKMTIFLHACADTIIYLILSIFLQYNKRKNYFSKWCR